MAYVYRKNLLTPTPSCKILLGTRFFNVFVTIATFQHDSSLACNSSFLDFFESFLGGFHSVWSIIILLKGPLPVPILTFGQIASHYLQETLWYDAEFIIGSVTSSCPVPGAVRKPQTRTFFPRFTLGVRFRSWKAICDLRHMSVTVATQPSLWFVLGRLFQEVIHWFMYFRYQFPQFS